MEVSIWIFLLLSVLKVIIVTVILLTSVAYTVLLERKLVGRIQNRWGPSRVGPFGLLQPLADGLEAVSQRRPDADQRVSPAVHPGADYRLELRAACRLRSCPSARIFATRASTCSRLPT